MNHSLVDSLPQVLPLNFSRTIDLIDETLREGSERSPLHPDLSGMVDLGTRIAHIGIRSIVVGMFPDVPHNVLLLRELLLAQQRGEILHDRRFIVISHPGAALDQTIKALRGLNLPLNSVWILVIFSVSDLQILHLLPKVLRGEHGTDSGLSSVPPIGLDHQRDWSLEWLDHFLARASSYDGGGLMLGLLDAFRSDPLHIEKAVSVGVRNGISQVRLVDTAGTCLPQQIEQWVGRLIDHFPDLAFYCHFHNDFGLATGNALLALARGAVGVDVSVGGLANRAGHPPLAEVVASLLLQYGVALPGFDHAALYALSRHAEDLFGVMESAVAPVTGAITHGVATGIRTELADAAAKMFTWIEPEFVGNRNIRALSARSGTNGLASILAQIHESDRDPQGLPSIEELKLAHESIQEEWRRRSSAFRQQLSELRDTYHRLLHQACFTEQEIITFLKSTTKQ